MTERQTYQIPSGIDESDDEMVRSRTEPLRIKRLERSERLLHRFGPDTKESILFSDEKFYNRRGYNSQNDRILA